MSDKEQDMIDNLMGADEGIGPGHPDFIEPGVRFIVKVQASLFTTESEQQVVIYNEDRTIQYQCPAADCLDMVAVLDPDVPKAFFWTTIDEEGRLQLDPNDIAEWQNW
jgi:hypothetical protein